MVAAGAKVRAVDIGTGIWSSYTPAWSSSGSQPVLGNGSITGRYAQHGDLVHFVGQLVAGSTTTYGTGTYAISLPVAAANLFSSNGIIGTCWIRDASGADFQGQLLDAGSAFNVRAASATYAGNQVWAATTPVTMASGDWISWHGTYEAA